MKGSGNPLPEGEKLTYALVGNQCGAFAVCDCMGGSIYCKNYWTSANVTKTDYSRWF